MKSIGNRIIRCCVLLVGVGMVVLGVFSCIMEFSSARSLTVNNMQEIVKIAAGRVEWELTAYSNIASGLGMATELSDPAAPAVVKQAILDGTTSQYGLQRCNLIDAEGNGIDGNTYSDRNYYQAAMRGQTMISEPLVSKVTGQLTVIVAAPLWKGGVANSEPVGCVYIVPNEEFMNDLMRDINISESGGAYMIDQNGNTIASADMEAVKNSENIETLAKTDASYADVAAAHAKMRAGETGFWAGTRLGVATFMAYIPVNNTNGWSLAVYGSESDFMKGVYTSFNVTLGALALGLIVAVFAAVRIGRSIGGNMRLCTERLKTLADGDLTSPIPDIRAKDETKVLADTTGALVSRLNGMIGDIGRILEAMANGDLSVSTAEGKDYYSGDFGKLRVFLKEINVRLSGAMSQINASADQVSASSSQVAGGAQTLSQGAAEQASSTQELAATIHIISDQVTQNSENCANARAVVKETAKYVETADREMTRLTEAMNDIKDTSGKIGNIIKTIEDIAFQTNILALNAAVEAARAGEAGKGFAVVADEVRSLASKSAEAAKDTTSLIEQSISAVQRGTEITTGTAAAMKNVGERTVSVEEIVDKIASASEQQAEMIVQVTSGVEQISGVVQSNSATAEENAATSEELSGQASTLKQLIGTFRLREQS